MAREGQFKLSFPVISNFVEECIEREFALIIDFEMDDRERRQQYPNISNLNSRPFGPDVWRGEGQTGAINVAFDANRWDDEDEDVQPGLDSRPLGFTTPNNAFGHVVSSSHVRRNSAQQSQDDPLAKTIRVMMRLLYVCLTSFSYVVLISL